MSDQPDSETSTWQRNSPKRHAFTVPAGFEPVISEAERPQSRALDRAATGIGLIS